MSNIDELLLEALTFESTEKLELIDKILASVYPVSKGVEELWNTESEERIDSHLKANLPSLDEESTFAKYKK
ncbi:MAG TPA: hypothetical protein EYG94_03540 [Campylobacterales bacterium]|nr:hypothetical protein [Campylobacterales bacterium]